MDTDFVWKDTNGVVHKLASMETRYLVNILKMLWNHHVKLKYQIRPFKQYAMPVRFTEDYVKQAFRNIMYEFLMRDDAMLFRAPVDHMIKHRKNTMFKNENK